MKTLTQISITLAMTLGLTSVAMAGDPKPPAPAPKKEEAKKEDAKKEEKKAEPAKKMEMKAPAELADMAKMMTGSWKCTGKATDPADMSKMIDMKMAMTMKLDLDKWWIVTTMTSPMFKGVSYTTYDPAGKKWYEFMMDSMGGSEATTSMGVKDNKVVWEGDSRSSMMPAMKVRNTHDMSTPKEGVKMTGEMSHDGGKTWMKSWEAVCKK